MINEKIWHEKLHRHVGQYFSIDKILYQKKNKYHDIIIFQNSIMGRIMAIDGVVQTTEKDEFIYHEMLTHVPIFYHGLIKNVLIVGGGDGGILREICRHKSIENITMVEIDLNIIDLCKQFFPKHNNNAYKDPRLKIVIDNGLNFVQKTKEKFDLIISDSTDPIGCGKDLFLSDFYFHCKNCLVKNGIFVGQNGVFFLQKNDINQSYKNLKKNFHDVSFYQATIPSYYGGTMMFSWGTDNIDFRQINIKNLEKRIKDKKLTFNYYNSNIHISSFYLPQYIINTLDKS
ncbi:polyamine aminopropyltransferase [Buchnera aphidicola]|jgi:spermidine synthase|uniref:Polyamine aminopropyltransferase n=1 Tax=Buchnera aphidicola subsp. Schizaphis graminum (strain Sg) TaxID=198804 RepID=SPEE_BUCAP|nr:polyamine aminopropyltransferase [Buchnera aphidicola]Q8K9T5.1 RecName: Full=Polyamine aminopropyltransferase; AltName: Full=Putrescine aminopropyltransferase; Short=PAPT; AltName: Full=Spermidine synthase; Short=SPDS; Short=SPDSY [Buchnera aphidicola str. Sg (Schizaphis graminum)]AAM67767.1 spermidine synthase [Buchnera aphidicola str. Sg (Schizaphis graminum)]AWI49736.1 polyamine aminopropyltransferase [Buchnera aphidicola (Schizaphis graminum)]